MIAFSETLYTFIDLKGKKLIIMKWGSIKLKIFSALHVYSDQNLAPLSLQVV